jgi:hypothetical protein
MTRGFEEDRCSPLGAGALLYPPPRCRRPAWAVQIRSAVSQSRRRWAGVGWALIRPPVSCFSPASVVAFWWSRRPLPDKLLQLFGNCFSQLPRLHWGTSPIAVRAIPGYTCRRVPPDTKTGSNSVLRAAIYSTIGIGWQKCIKRLKPENRKRSINNMYKFHIFIQYGIYSWHELA